MTEQVIHAIGDTPGERRSDYAELVAVKRMTEQLWQQCDAEGAPEWVGLFERGVAYDTQLKEWVVADYVESVTILPNGRNTHKQFVVPDVDPQAPDTRIAGTLQTVMATARYLQARVAEGRVVKAVLLGAGRPAYIREAISSGLAPEGFCGGEVVLKTLRDHLPPDFLEHNGIGVEMFPESVNSLSDLQGFIHTTRQQGGAFLTGITIQSHADRVNWLKTWSITQEGGMVGVQVLSTEEILRSLAPAEYQRIAPFIGSEAYLATLAEDNQGIEDFFSGRYLSTQVLVPSTQL